MRVALTNQNNGDRSFDADSITQRRLGCGLTSHQIVYCGVISLSTGYPLRLRVAKLLFFSLMCPDRNYTVAGATAKYECYSRTACSRAVYASRYRFVIVLLCLWYSYWCAVLKCVEPRYCVLFMLILIVAHVKAKFACPQSIWINELTS